MKRKILLYLLNLIRGRKEKDNDDDGKNVRRGCGWKIPKEDMAEYFSLDEGFLEDAHDRSVREVRQTNGILNLAQVMSEVREEKE